jgi:protein SMG6
MIATRPFETARESVLPLWSPAAQARRSAPDARAPELFVFLHGMLFTNIQLDDFTPTLSRLLERLSIEEPETREWTMMAAINIGALIEYGRPQGVLRRADVLGQLDRNPGAAAAATKVKLARKVHTEEKMEVDGDERRRSSDMEAPNARRPSTDATESQEPPFAFKMAQELTFSMLAHALRSTRDGPNPYVTILLTFLQTVIRKPEGLASLERAIPWTDLAAFLSQGPRAPSSWAQIEKLSQSSILLEDWAIRGMAWHGHLFERGFWDGNEEQLMEMEMLDARNSPAEAMDGDGMWEDDEESEKSKPCRATLAWRRALWAGMKIANKVSGFRWDEKRSWSIDGALAEKARQWEEEARQAREEEERRKMGRRWVDGEGDQMMDEEEENADNMSESGSEDDENDPEEIKALKV